MNIASTSRRPPDRVVHELRFERVLRVAAATLGHSSAKLTDEVYAERGMHASPRS